MRGSSGLIDVTALISVVLPTALGIALAIVPISARAETKARGTPQAVVVEAANAAEQFALCLGARPSPTSGGKR